MEKVNDQDPFSLIYFGSPSTRVGLSPIKGKLFPYERNLCSNHRDNQTVALSLVNKFSLRHLGPDYSNCHVIAIPANEVLCKKLDHDLYECTQSDDKIENICLIKTRCTSTFIGYKSGIRSAILPLDGKYYRLKGCGNLEDGFISREMGFPKDGLEVRGCQFRGTALRELYMSDRIKEILNKHGFVVNNKPVCMWKYTEDKEEYKKLEIKNDFMRVDKICSVYEIISEKRLGRHLFPGIEIMLLEMVNDYFKSNSVADYKEFVASLFPKERIFYKTKDGVKYIDEINSTYEYVPLLELNQEEGDDISSLFVKYQVYKSLNSEGKLVNLIEMIENKKDQHPILTHLNSLNVEAFLLEYFTRHQIFTKFNEVNKKTEELMKEKLKQLQSKFNDKTTNLLELIGLIYARTGWEAGKMKRIMQDNNFNWGTYEDLKFRLHCNAHTDNFAIFPRDKSTNSNLLTILDFDLAFFKENFINIADETDSSKYGLPDDFLFDFYLNVERQHLEWEFAGMENVISFEHFSKLMDSDEMFKFNAKSFVSLIRDVSVIYFRKGYLLNEFDIEKRYIELLSEVYDMIEIALFITHDFIG